MTSPVSPTLLMTASCTGWRLSMAVSLEGCLFTISKHLSFNLLALRICLLKMSFHFLSLYIFFCAFKKKNYVHLLQFLRPLFTTVCCVDKCSALFPFLGLAGASSFPLLQGLCASFLCVSSTFATHCNTGSTPGEDLLGAAGIF